MRYMRIVATFLVIQAIRFQRLTEKEGHFFRLDNGR